MYDPQGAIFFMYLLCLKAKRVLFPMSDRNRLSLLTLVEPCRDRDCKIMFYIMSRKTNLTKQNKESPSIPLLTYYNFSYPVTQRQALYLFNSTPLSVFLPYIHNGFLQHQSKMLHLLYRAATQRVS